MVNTIKDLVISFPDFKLKDVIDPEQFDTNNKDILLKMNELVEVINKLRLSTTDTDSGADNIAVTPVTGIAGNTLQVILEAIKNIIDSHMADGNNPHNVTAEQLNTYTKDELNPYLLSGDTVIKEEVFKIVTLDNGNGTFTYHDVAKNVDVTGTKVNGHYRFTLVDGEYNVGENRIEGILNKVSHHSVGDGGLTEDDSTHVTFTDALAVNDTIVFKYFEKIGAYGRHASTHQAGGNDMLIVSEPMLESTLHDRIYGDRTNVNLAFNVEVRNDDPANATIGRMWYRQDL